MNRTSSIVGIDAAAERLRRMARHSADGSLLGSENFLIAQIGTSRATLRQAARVLEREGLIKVRRGIGGGYFAARPGFNSIQFEFAARNQTVAPTEVDLTEVPSLLWVEAVRRAAGLKTEETRRLVKQFLARIRAVPPDAGWDAVYGIERDCREAIFGLVRCGFIKTLFDTCTAFAYRRGFPNPADGDHTAFGAELAPPVGGRSRPRPVEVPLRPAADHWPIAAEVHMLSMAAGRSSTAAADRILPG